MKKEDFKKYLKEINFSEELVEEISSYVDNEKDIEVLCDKIKFLNKNGVSNTGIELIISENPLFLTTSLETVKASVNFLKNIKLENVEKVVEINSELLSVSDKTMSENYKLLKILMTEKELLNMLKIDAEILSFNTDYLEKRLEYFIKNGLKDKIKDIILNYFEAFEDEEDEIDLETLKENLI
jgi:hypothetical protein